MNNLNKWLNKRTFHHAQFNDMNGLLVQKQGLGLKISLCLPTLNEAGTIGKEIILLKSELMERYPILDEIAVIDSGSTDNTVEIAKKFGAKVFLASEHLKEEGEKRGKGENLWKALYLLEGDIIVYIDADIANIHPKFVCGLIGPMLYNPHIKFVKGFYDRPLTLSQGVRTSGGGRVTEILIRPLFSQFFPELTGIIQPLSGEYAGYRSILEKLHFPVGYGVETGMLIDIFQKWGLDVIAQTDLDSRVHSNKQTRELGKMSFGILQTFWNRLARYKNLDSIEIENYRMMQVGMKNDTPFVEDTEIKEKERRPMIEVPAYLEKFPPQPE
ncbi:MAG: glucosyl-3-phosphoglycerate synthase [Fibrobacteria bacterium]|nr:glucosyl-3-phosphoglycerate synthase [Fibrobacteria bacterium]